MGERLSFSGVQTTGGRTVTDITNFETSDIKSVYGIVGSAGTFTADLIQRLRRQLSELHQFPPLLVVFQL